MKRIEHLIVGQGLAGTMLAFELLSKNIDFRIVSSQQKSKASLVAAGMVNPLVFKRMTKSWNVDEILPFMMTRFKELEDLLNGQFYFEKKILKPLSQQECELWKEREKEQGFQAYIDGIIEETPSEFICKNTAYGLVKNAGYLNLSSFLSASEEYFSQEGLLIKEDFNSGGIQSTGNFVLGDKEVKKIIFCEGYHLVNNILFEKVKMNPAKGEVLLIHTPDLSEEYIYNKLVFILPVGNQMFKVGSTYEWDDLSELPTEKGKLSIKERLDRLISCKYTIIEHWAGVRPTISDRRPVLGKHPAFDNIYVFNGLGTKGVMLAPRMAQLMANYLFNNEELPSEINLNRFF